MYNTVGINTTPSTELHIKGANDDANGQLKLESTGTDARIHFINSSGDSSTSGNADILMSATSGYEGLRFMIDNSDKMIIDENGRIGIGTTSPDVNLHLDSSSTTELRIQDGTNKVLRIKQQNNGAFLTAETGNSLTFTTNGSTTAMHIDTSQRVGIGTDSPYYITDIRFANTNTSFSGGSNGNWGSNGLRIENTSDTNGTMASIHLRNESADIHIAGIRTGSNTSDLGIFNEGSEKMRITSAGDVQITDTTASSTTEGGYLRLASDDGAVMASGHRLGVIEFAGAVDTSHTITSGAKIQAMTDATWSGSEHGTVLDFYTSDGSTALGSGQPMMRITAAGRIGIGRDNPGQALDVNGNVTSNIYYGTTLHSNSGDLTLTSNNSQTKIFLDQAPGAIDFYPANSLRFKLDDSSRISLSNNDGGTANTIFGSLAGESIDSGAANNVYIGSTAGRQLNNAANDSNVAIGSAAMLGAGTGTRTANKNIGIGTQALQNITTGTSNVAVGDVAMLSITTGSSNVAIGASAGNAITSDARVVAIGSSAYSANDTTNGHDGTASNGSGNMAIGYKSMTALNDVNAFRNTMVGYETMVDCGSANASDNTALGFRALKSINNNSSDRNTAIGSSSLFALTTGTQNVAMGTSTGATMTTSSNNVLIGHNSGTAINAGQTTTDGTVAIGSLALTALTSGSGNTALGYEAGKLMTDNTNNTIIGYQAFVAADAGENDNVVIGHLAGSANNSASTDGNVLIGKNAGVGGAGLMNSCIYIGKNAGENTHVRNQYDNVFIGRGAAGIAFGGQSDNNVGVGSLILHQIYLLK